jgi:hypothetical protein
MKGMTEHVMLKRMRAISTVCLALVWALGAAKTHHSIVGKWSCSAHGVTISLTFGPRAHFTQSVLYKVATTMFAGTYQLRGRRLHVHITSRTGDMSANVENLDMPDARDGATVTWKDGNHIFIIGDKITGPQPLFSRVK